MRFDRPGDVATVLRVLYLLFDEGYSGDIDLSAEAIRLTRQLTARIDHPDVAGLLALLLLHHARRTGGAPGTQPGRMRSPGTPGRPPQRPPLPLTVRARMRSRLSSGEPPPPGSDEGIRGQLTRPSLSPFFPPRPLEPAR